MNYSTKIMEAIDSYNNAGVKCFIEGDFENAEFFYRKAIVEEPENSSVFNNLGFLLAQQGKLDEAKALLQKSLTLNQESDSTHLNIANIFLLENNLERSHFHLLKSIYLNPQNAFAYEGLANIYLKQQKTEEAIIAFQQSIELNPTNNNLKNTYASLLLTVGQVDKSSEFYYGVFLSNPEDIEALIGVGITSFIKKDYNIAQTFLKRALGIEPENKKARQHLAYCFLSMGENSEGIKEYERILMLYPNDIEAKTDLAVIHLSLGNKDIAQDYINQVLKITTLPKAVYYQGILCHLNKDFDNAFKILSELKASKNNYSLKANEYLEMYFEI